MSKLTAAERSMIARAGAYAMHAKYDARITGAPGLKAAREAVDRRLIEQYQLDATSPDFEENLARARKSRHLLIQQKGVAARRAKREQ